MHWPKAEGSLDEEGVFIMIERDHEPYGSDLIADDKLRREATPMFKIGDAVRLVDVYGNVSNIKNHKGHIIYTVETVLEPGTFLWCDCLESNLQDLKKEGEDLDKDYEDKDKKVV